MPPSNSNSEPSSKPSRKRAGSAPQPSDDELDAQRRRYRVTGGIFLAALAIIVLPMLFDPAAPTAVELPTAAVDAEVPTLGPPPTILSDEGFIADAQAEEARVDEDGYDRDSGGRIGEPVLVEPSESSSPAAAEPGSGAQPLWAVQVAAFADRANARAFRDQLKKDGYSAFTTSIKRSGSILHRVAVGPLVSRSDAESERQALARRYELEAIIVEFEA